MKTQSARKAVDCLYIDEFTSGATTASGPLFPTGLPWIGLRPFRCVPGENLWERLQVALQELRADCGAAGILARGTGCAAALALAEQLPVDRLALVDPRLEPQKPRWIGGAATGPSHGHSASFRRQIHRLCGFARRNLSLCVSDVMIVEYRRGGEADAICRALSANSRVLRLCLYGENGGKMYTNRENTVKQAISGFLHSGELPKPLAENPEMCIIYG